MRIKSIVCIALVLLTVVTGKRKRDWGCKELRSQIQIYRPSGLRVIQNSANLQSFGIKVYINKPTSATRSYDLWINTTVVDPVSNSYILYEPMAIIRPRDLFDYSIMKQYKNGALRWYNCKAFHVHESRIKPSPQTRPGSSKPRAADQRDEKRTTSFLTNQKVILEETINDLANNCAGPSFTNNFYLTEHKDVVTESGLKNIIIGRLAQLLPAVDWNDVVTNVFSWKGLVGFEVKTAVDKLKILRLMQVTQEAAEVIRDLDTSQSSVRVNDGDDYEEYESSTPMYDE